MGLKLLDTTVSLQGILNDTKSVKAPNTVKKIPKGGFAQGTNGIINSAFVTPLPYVPNVKISSLFVMPTFDDQVLVTNEGESQSQAASNNGLAIHDAAPEILASYSFTADDASYLVAAAYQAYVEDRCSLKFAEAIVKLVNQKDDKFLPTILQKLNEELKLADSQLQSLSSFVKTCLELNGSLNSVPVASVRQVTRQKYDKMGPDKLIPGGDEWFDPASLLLHFGADKDAISARSNTALIHQVLLLASKMLRNGASTISLGSDSLFPGKLVAPGSVTTPNYAANYVESNLSNDNQFNLGKLSLSKTPNSSFLYNVAEDVSYIEKLKLNTLKVSPLQRAAYLSSVVANEFALSAGLARLNGTPLGASFGTAGNYLSSFFGAEGTDSAVAEATAVGSLVDYLVVNVNGSNRVSSENGVLLFDGSKISSTKKRKNSYDQFVAGTIRSPLSAEKNGSQRLSAALEAANNRFELGTQFYTKLTCRDKKSKLLSPRGLFTRLVADFSNSLADFYSQEKVGNSSAARQLAFLSILANESKSDSNKNSEANVIKRSILNGMAQRALQLQTSGDTPDATTSEKESQKSGNSSKKFIPNPSNPRLCLDENLLFQSSITDIYTPEVMLSVADLPRSSDKVGTSYATINFTTYQFFVDLLDSKDGFIEKLVKIYVDACNEATQFCQDDDASSSIVTPSRLTRNGQTDGVLLLSLLLESACILSAEFVDAKIAPLSDLQTVRNALSPNKTKTDEDYAQLFTLATILTRINVRVGSDSKTYTASSALSAIAKASAGDDFVSLFLKENGNLVVPELNSLPPTTQISCNSQAPLTVSNVVDTFYDLSMERELPSICLCTAAAVVQVISSLSSKYVEIGSALLGATKQTDNSKAIASFAKSEIGDRFLSSMNKFSLGNASSKLEDVKNEMAAVGGRISRLSLGELRCMQVIMNAVTWEPNNSFVITALPKDFVIKSLKSTYAADLDRGNNLQDDLMSLRVEKTAIFDDNSSSFSTKLMVRSPLSEASFKIFETVPPQSADDVYANVTLDSGISGSKFVDQKLDKGLAYEVLKNEVISYLMRKLFSVLSAADLFSKNISDGEGFGLDPSSPTIARQFASTYGLDSSTFDNCFLKQPGGTSKISAGSLLDLSKQDFDIAESSLNVKLPTLSFGEAELFYDIFNSVFFQTGALQKRIFSSTIFDETVGIVVNSSLFPESEGQAVTTNGVYRVSGISKPLQKISKSQQTPSFDTYSVSVSAADGLVNK